MRKALNLLVIGAAVALVAAGCASDDTRTFTFGSVPASVTGNVATIPVELGEGLEIVKADGKTDDTRGHFHVFIDRDPVGVGDVIPKEAGIVHTTDNPIKLYGLSVGKHEVTVVIGDGTHTRFGENLEQSTTIDVKGPSVDATAPATLKDGEDLKIELESEGVEIVKADGDRSGKTGHYHVLVDPATPPKAGEIVPAAVENNIVHTTEASTTIAGLAKGEHTIWVLLGDGTHTAFEPAVMDKLTVTVT